MYSFYLNNREVLTDAPGKTSLATFIRSEQGLTGTKTGCREGDCGSCTVIVSAGKSFKAINSCLTPIANIHRHHVLTIEGVNKYVGKIAEIIISENATQCGFCTPGIMMSITSVLLNGDLNFDKLLRAVAGNLCRCTGYKSIERALRKISQLDLGQIPKIEFKNISGIRSVKGKIGKNSRVIAGGTDLLLHDDLMDSIEHSYFISMLSVKEKKDLAKIKKVKGNYILGALVTINDVMDYPEFDQKFSFKKHISTIASDQIRNTATICGNIANGSPIGDLASIFLALEAELIISDFKKERIVSLNDFYTGYKENVLRNGELILRIQFPCPTESCIFNFEKIGQRKTLDLAEVNSSVLANVEGKRIIKISISAGGVFETPMRLRKTENKILNCDITDHNFKDILATAYEEIKPIEPVKFKKLLLKQQLFIHLTKLNQDLSLKALV